MDRFEKLNCFLLFLGRGRSGSSLCGGLISCHPNAVITHQKEFKNFKFEDENDLYNFLLDAHNHNQKKFIWKPLRNESEWKNMKDYNNIQVIGTKKQVIKKIKEFSKLNELKKKLSVPIKFINIYRNPFDNIATIYNKSQLTKHIKRGKNMKSLDKAISYYFNGMKMTQEVINTEPTINVQHENLVDNTKEVLTNICKFLNLPLINEYLDFCETMVWDKARQSRYSVDWSDKYISRVNEFKDNYDFLKEYRLES